MRPMMGRCLDGRAGVIGAVEVVQSAGTPDAWSLLTDWGGVSQCELQYRCYYRARDTGCRMKIVRDVVVFSREMFDSAAKFRASETQLHERIHRREQLLRHFHLHQLRTSEMHGRH